jgi:Ulp1 family protease
VLLRNLKRADRKGGKTSSPWLGPYKVVEIFSNNTCRLESENGELKKIHNVGNLKKFVVREMPHNEAEASSEVMSEVATVTHCNSWNADLNLTLDDRSTIANNESLTDSIIDAAQQLLTTQHGANGTETPLLCQSSGFTPTPHQSVQIHYDPERSHWITSSTTRQRVEVADSLSNGALTRSIQEQLLQKYGTVGQGGSLPVYLLPVKQQVNGVDCGVHAIANAIEFLIEDGNPLANYDIAAMRPHLLACLESGQLLPFPKCHKKMRGRQAKIKVINIVTE